MIASFLRYFNRWWDPMQSSREAIITLRQQTDMIDRKGEYLEKKIDEETEKAKASVLTDKPVAIAALRRRKATEQEFERLQDARLQLEIQINTLESANLNARTLGAMQRANTAMGDTHTQLTALHSALSQFREYNTRSTIDVLRSEPTCSTLPGLDGDELKAELEQLEQDVLYEQRVESGELPSVPIYTLPIVDDGAEEEELEQLQLALAM
ncbi:hypothetical protein PHLCEN_2v9352 [Hermanssonia centrifuga]|uniref:Vacuolar-sorting protein SNF7 n=1 Tax=Hermanssonia centrifuga TaxID=98765 RepID=A0A2R6NR08_9APHY|nr:hypothetical protein PHLCEN_2v9352 [Hermanssonia centrifuga]